MEFYQLRKKYKDYSREIPKLKNCKRLEIKCDFCGNLFWEKPSAYKKKKKHFCSMKCYSEFRKKKLTFDKQPAYKGIRKVGEGKQIYHVRYVEKNPKRISHLKAWRYARKKNAVGTHTLEQWNNLLLEYNFRCAVCGKKKILTKDHIIPLSEDGTDYIDNIQPLCRNCNSKKWKKIPQ